MLSTPETKTEGDTTMQTSKKRSVTLWTVQGLLAALFLFAGGMKLVLPVEMLKGPIALPELFVRFIGVAEFTGALGLVLPGIFRIRRDLTPLAALGLVAIMTGATTLTLEAGQLVGAAVPFVVGCLAVSVAFGRREWVAPRAPTSQPVARQLQKAA
jgi:hypothetical protein